MKLWFGAILLIAGVVLAFAFDAIDKRTPAEFRRGPLPTWVALLVALVGLIAFISAL